jgi:hypothetical protein
MQRLELTAILNDLRSLLHEPAFRPAVFRVLAQRAPTVEPDEVDCEGWEGSAVNGEGR